jgi:hypothetical protein
VSGGTTDGDEIPSSLWLTRRATLRSLALAATKLTQAITRFEHCDHGPVGGCEIDRADVGKGNPGHRDVFMGMRRIARFSEHAHERQHFDQHGPVVVREGTQSATNRNVAAQLFFNFALKGRFGRLTRFDLAAGEFPFRSEVLVSGTLCQEDAASAVLDDGTDNANETAGSHEMNRRSKSGFRCGVRCVLVPFLSSTRSRS